MPFSNPESFVTAVAAKRRALMRWLLLANLVAGLLLAGLVWSVLSSSRRSYEVRARDMAEALAAVAQLNIGSELSQVDAVLRSTLHDLVLPGLREQAGDEGINRLLQTRLGVLKGVEGLRLSDAQGRVRWGTGLMPGDVPDIGQRDFFPLARENTVALPIVSGPLQSRLSEHWVVAVARPLFHDGQFAGVLYVTIAVDHFAQLFSRYALSEQDAVTLRTSDLRLVARRAPGSATQGDVGTTAVSAELLEAMKHHPDAGAFVSRVAIDGVQRTTAYRRVQGWPLTVFAGVSNDRFFQPWHDQAWNVSLVAALAWALVVAATLAVYRFGIREAAALHGIADHARAQRQAQQRISLLLKEQTAMLDNDLVSMVKLEQRCITWCNHAFESLHGYAPGELRGQPMSALYADADAFERVGREAYPVLATGANYRTQVRMLRKDGSSLWVDINGSRLSDRETFWMAIDVTATKAAHERLLHVAHHDPLTQLPNRVLLLDRLKQSLAVSERSGAEVAVCYLDLDGFKAVNDRLGHDAGDALLVEVARRMERQLRPADTVARIGGDEFVLVLSAVRPGGWQPIVDRVMTAVQLPIRLAGDQEVRVGTSAGVVTSATGRADPAELLTRADQALLAAKRGGKGCVQVFRAAEPDLQAAEA